jgi:hypothetical protein
MILYHCTTPKKAKSYRATGFIQRPVRGFTTILSALAWCVKTHRTVIYEIDSGESPSYKLPDHHNKYGDAWWIDGDIYDFVCVFSADKDA